MYQNFFLQNLVLFIFQVNELQAKIKETTRKMMALVSELSMNQANALKLQQNLKEKEADLEQCYIRMEKGEAPSDEIQAEWFKILRDEDRRSRDKEEIRLVNFISSFDQSKERVFHSDLNQCCCIIQGYDKCKSFITGSQKFSKDL